MKKGDMVTLKIEIGTVGNQHLYVDDTGVIEGDDDDHYFVNFNGETVAFRKDEVDEELTAQPPVLVCRECGELFSVK